MDIHSGSVSRNERVVNWNHENRLSWPNGSGKDEYYYYNPGGQRARKKNSTSNAFYINPMYEVITGNGSVVAADAASSLGLAENEAGEIDPARADAIQAQLDAVVAAIPMEAPEVPDFDPASASSMDTLQPQLYLPVMNGIIYQEAEPNEQTVEVSGDQIPTEEGADVPEVVAAGVNATTVNKYYFFAGQRIAMRKNGTFYYLHNDHLGSTYSATNSSGNQHSAQSYKAFGKYRGGTNLPTDNRFTGQKLDTTGLMLVFRRFKKG